MWNNLDKAGKLADIRPVPDDIIEKIQAVAEKTVDPVEKAMIENLMLMFVMYKREHGRFDGY